jgi:hypothetical protein
MTAAWLLARAVPKALESLTAPRDDRRYKTIDAEFRAPTS